MTTDKFLYRILNSLSRVVAGYKFGSCFKPREKEAYCKPYDHPKQWKSTCLVRFMTDKPLLNAHPGFSKELIKYSFRVWVISLLHSLVSRFLRSQDYSLGFGLSLIVPIEVYFLLQIWFVDSSLSLEFLLSCFSLLLFSIVFWFFGFFLEIFFWIEVPFVLGLKTRQRSVCLLWIRFPWTPFFYRFTQSRDLNVQMGID